MHTRLLKTLLILIVIVSSSIAVIAQQSNSASSPTVGTLTKINPETRLKESNLPVKDVSKELNFPKNGEVFIESNDHNVIIKIWDQQKVKITTGSSYNETESKLSDEELLDRIGVSLKVVGNSVKIKSAFPNTTYNGSYYGSYGASNGNLTFTSGKNLNGNFSNASRKKIIVMIPSGTKVDIEGKYADISLPQGITEATIDITNGNLDAENLNKLNLRSKYASVNVGNVKNAEIEMTNGRFSGGNIDELDIETKYSTVEMARVEKMVIRSTNDEYEVEEIATISGRKNYGNLRITKLYKTIDLEGANADIKIRNLASTVSLINIDNKYADIRIPLKNVKNYQVDFIGFYSSVYGSFEKQPLGLSEKEMKSLQPTISSRGKLVNVNDNDFSGSQITSLGTLTNITVTGVIKDATGKLINTENGKPVTLTTGTLTSVAPAYVFSGSLRQNTSGSTAVASANNLTVTGNVTSINGQLVPNTVAGSQSTSNGTIVGGTIQGIVTPTITATTIPGTYGTLNGGTLRATTIHNYATDNDTPTKFTSTVGDGKGLKIDMKCLNCTVDFK